MKPVLEFTRQRDRFQHAWSWASPLPKTDSTTPQPILWSSSVVPTDSHQGEILPDPPLQQVLSQTVAAIPVTWGLGAAGRGHWSASFSEGLPPAAKFSAEDLPFGSREAMADPQNSSPVFQWWIELAVRGDVPAVELGSSYFWAPNWCLQSFTPQSACWIARPEPAESPRRPERLESPLEQFSEWRCEVLVPPPRGRLEVLASQQALKIVPNLAEKSDEATICWDFLVRFWHPAV